MEVTVGRSESDAKALIARTYGSEVAKALTGIVDVRSTLCTNAAFGKVIQDPELIKFAGFLRGKAPEHTARMADIMLSSQSCSYREALEKLNWSLFDIHLVEVTSKSELFNSDNPLGTQGNNLYQRLKAAAALVAMDHYATGGAGLGMAVGLAENFMTIGLHMSEPTRSFLLVEAENVLILLRRSEPVTDRRLPQPIDVAASADAPL